MKTLFIDNKAPGMECVLIGVFKCSTKAKIQNIKNTTCVTKIFAMHNFIINHC